jgi:hypothetical protein
VIVGSRALLAERARMLGLDIELAPYLPDGGAGKPKPGRLEVLVSARTLSRERLQDGGFYDELLTVAPPLRLMGGVQVRF